MRVLMMVACAAWLVSCSTLAPCGSMISSPNGSVANHPALLNSTPISCPASIPDGDSGGVTLGPIEVVDDGEKMKDLGLRLDIQHGCTGDLSLWLCYDSNNDGFYDASAPVEFYKGRLGGYEAAEPYADPKCLEGNYHFRGELLSAFDGLNKGGSFYLVVTDTLGEYEGNVRNWMIHSTASISGLERELSHK